MSDRNSPPVTRGDFPLHESSSLDVEGDESVDEIVQMAPPGWEPEFATVSNHAPGPFAWQKQVGDIDSELPYDPETSVTHWKVTVAQQDDGAWKATQTAQIDGRMGIIDDRTYTLVKFCGLGEAISNALWFMTLVNRTPDHWSVIKPSLHHQRWESTDGRYRLTLTQEPRDLQENRTFNIYVKDTQQRGGLAEQLVYENSDSLRLRDGYVSAIAYLRTHHHPERPERNDVGTPVPTPNA